MIHLHVYKEVSYIKITEENKEYFRSTMDSHICGYERFAITTISRESIVRRTQQVQYGLSTSKVGPNPLQNVSSYVAHLLAKVLGFREGKINCIPNGREIHQPFKAVS